MKTKMKRISAILLAGVLATSLPAQASGIPVYDGGNFAQNMANHLKEMAELAKQLEQMEAQLQQAKQQYESLTGSRNLGSVFQDAVKNIPDEWANLYSNKSLSSNTSQVLSGKGYSQQTAAQQLVNYQNMIIKELQGTKSRLRSIQGLMATINRTKDPKAIAELQGRIQSEQASIQHTQVQLDMLDRMVKTEEKIQQRKYSNQQACYAKQIRSGNYKACQ